MGKKTSSGGTQTTKITPPDYQLPYLQGGMQQSQNLFNQGGPQQYTGNTVTPFSSQTEQALGGIQQRALNGSPLVDAAQNFAQRGLQTPVSSSFGTGPNPYAGATNPYLDQVFNHAADQSYSNLAGEYARGGRNIGASMPVQSDILSGLANQIYAPAYENSQNRALQYDTQQQGLRANDLQSQRMNQQGLLSSALPLANQDYTDLGQLAGVGNQIENKTGQIIDDRVNRWNFEQNRPQQNLDSFLQRVNGTNVGQNQTTKLPNQQSSPLAGLLGGGLAGASLGAMTAAPGATGLAALGGPWGIGIGAGLGLLGSIF